MVAAEGDELADAADAGAETWRALDLGQALEVEILQRVERIRQQHRAADVGDVAREIAQRAPAVYSPGLFLAYGRSEEHTSELQSLMRISYAVFCLKKKNKTNKLQPQHYAIT